MSGKSAGQTAIKSSVPALTAADASQSVKSVIQTIPPLIPFPVSPFSLVPTGH